MPQTPDHPTRPKAGIPARVLLVGGAIFVLATAMPFYFPVLFTYLFPVVAVLVVLASFTGPLILALPGVFVRRGARVADPRTELDRRARAWSALSELYLDTELDLGDRERIVNQLAATGYHVNELAQIIYLEVHPALFWNLLSMAGEWLGFDPQWLQAEILRKCRRPRRLHLIFGMWISYLQWRPIRRALQEKLASQ